MISDADRAAIRAAVDALDVSAWAPLSDAERDLVSRALAPSTTHDPRAGRSRRTTRPGRAPGRRTGTGRPAAPSADTTTDRSASRVPQQEPITTPT